MNFERVHFYDVIRLNKSGTGKELNLPNNLIAYNNYGNIEVRENDRTKHLKDTKIYKLHEGENQIHNHKIVITDVIGKEFNFNNKYVRYFDKDKIEGEIIFRYRKDGDKINPLGMKGSKKIKDLFIDMKVPKEQRDGIPLICFGERIAWIAGYKTSEEFKVDKDTKNIIEIKFEREEKR